MKKIFFLISTFLCVVTYGQVYTNGNATPSQTGKTPFLDASSSFSNSVSFNNDIGKGIVFPDTDLTTFQFVNLDELDGANNPTAFDGMIVYNTGTGNTATNQVTTSTAVTPGFYYFYNPAGVNQGGTSVSAGRWIRLGEGGASSSYTPADYKSGAAVLTGEKFFTSATDSKPIYRNMVEVTFNNTSYAKLPDNTFSAKTVFIKTSLIDPTSGKVVLNSTEFSPATSYNNVSGDYIVAAYGNVYTTLSGTYNLIVEYYTKD